MPGRGAARGCAVLALALIGGPAARAEGWNGGVAIASDNVLRGLSQTDGRPSLLLDIGYRSDSGWAAGMGLATLSRGVEATVTLSRAWQLDADWSGQLGAAHYAYPGSNQIRLYDYDELFASLGWRGRGFVSLALSPDTEAYDAARAELRKGTALTYEFNWREPLIGRLAANAGLGYYDLHRIVDAGYAYGSAGLTWSYERVQAHLTYVGSRAAARGLATPSIAGERWIATLVWSF